MAQPRRSGFRRTSARRKTSWAFGPTDVDTSLATTQTTLWTTFIALTVPEVTIVRIRGMASAYLQSATAVGDGFRGAVGIALVTAEAITAGVASVPTPLGDDDWDGWIWHSYFDVRAVTSTIADGVNAGGAVVRIPIDSKAMRIWNDNLRLFGVWEVVESGTAVAEAVASTRVLVKLP